MATVDVTDATFQETVDGDGIVLVDAWASWCGPCKAFAPIYEKSSEDHQDVTFAKLDTEANQTTAAALGIQAIPTLMMYRDGELLFAQAGVLNNAQLDDLITQAKALDMDEVRRKKAEQAQG